MTKIRLAGQEIYLDNKFSHIERLCKDYIIEEENIESFKKTGQYQDKRNFFSVTMEEIKREQEGGEIVDNGYLESLAFYRKICEAFLEKEIFLFHSSALKIDGKAVLFTAPSGTGKSTHARMWREVFGERVEMINDDKPLIEIRREGAFVYGTPWCGKHGLQNNISAPILAIYLLEQAKKNEVRELSFLEAYPMMLNQTYRPQEEGKMRKTLALLNQLMKNVSIYKVKCNISPEAAMKAYEKLEKKDKIFKR